MSLNVFMDLKYLITKNYWHLIFFSLSIVLCVIQNKNVLALLVIAIVALIIGVLIREKMPLAKFSPGDTKMIVISSMYLYILGSLKIHWLMIPILLHVTVFILSAVIYGLIVILLFVKKYIFTRTISGYHSFKFLKISIELTTEGLKIISMSYRFPAAISIIAGFMSLVLLQW
ncbi:hypothetical protein [Bacillus thuringiensis]|uniref:hypothetical protein n=1 Tax=Bacillus thuringiensis TaxID=1428 RepID=UPI0020D27163|nr:hypothetical protein [Bacillus thuringiensis]